MCEGLTEFLCVHGSNLSGDFFAYPWGRRAAAWAEDKTQHNGKSYKSFTS